MRQKDTKNQRFKGLFLRGSTYWYRYSLHGKQHFVSTGEKDEAKALEVAKTMREQFLLNAETSRSGGGYRIDEAIERYTNSLDRNGRSLRHVSETKSGLERWQRETGFELMSDVTATRLQRWFNDKIEKGGVKIPTADRYLAHVRGLFDHALQAGRVSRNPVDDVVVPKFKHVMRDVWIPIEGMNKLLDHCMDRELKYAMYCSFHAGLRYEEVVMSRPEWFNLSLKTLTVRMDPMPNGWKPKDREQRTIPLTDEFYSFLMNEYPLRGPYMMAPNIQKGSARYRYDFKKRFTRYIREHGFAGYTFHDLRRSFASQHASAGTSLYKIAKWLGDGAQVVENHYGHLQAYDDGINLPGQRSATTNVIPMRASA
jgi:integrase